VTWPSSVKHLPANIAHPSMSEIWPGPYFVAPIQDGDTEILICNPEEHVASLELSAPLDHPDAARPLDIATAEFFVQAANQKPDSDQLAKLFLEFMAILETREESDSGNEFSPTTITSCRCMVSDRLAKILPEMKRLAAQTQQPYNSFPNEPVANG